jgi:hypothetical protein
MATVSVQRLRPTRAPNLAVAAVNYDQRYQDQLNNQLRIYFNTLDNLLGALVNPSISGSILEFPSASFQDNTTQSGSLTHPTPLTYSQIDFTHQFTLGDHTASFTGSRSGTTLTVSALASGYIYPSMHITGTGWASAVVTASITAGVMNVTAVTSGTLAVGQYLTGTGIVTGTRISQLITGTGGTGTYEINLPDGTLATVASTTVTAYGTQITDQLTGTAGGVGTYKVSTSGTIASASLTGRCTSKITAPVAGTYNLQWSGQFSSLSNSSETAYVWIRINGVDLPGSTGQAGLLPRKSAGVANAMIIGWNYYVELDAGEYVEFFWLTTSTDVTIATFPKSTSPAYPATASVIATIGFVSARYP